MALELPCEADIRCSAETIFDLIADFGNQERWLGKSFRQPMTGRLRTGTIGRRTLLALKAYADTLA